MEYYTESNDKLHMGNNNVKIKSFFRSISQNKFKCKESEIRSKYIYKWNRGQRKSVNY